MPEGRGGGGAQSGRRGLGVEAVHHVGEQGRVGLPRQDQVGPRAEHALKVVRARGREHRMDGPAGGHLGERRPRCARAGRRPAPATSSRVKPGSTVTAVDVGPRRQDGVHLARRTRSGAARSRRESTVGQPCTRSKRRKARVLPITWWADSCDATEPIDSPAVTCTTSRAARRPEGVGLQLVPEDERQHDDQDRTAEHLTSAGAAAGAVGAARCA